MVKEGEAAPAFKLQDDQGNWVSLSDFRGEHVVLYFYPKDDTPGCTAEACAFRDQSTEFKTRGIAILGVSADSVESHEKFKSKYALHFPLLSDPDKKVMKAYGVWKEKAMYGKKYMGAERTTVIIDEHGNIEKVFSKVKVAGHVKEILDKFSASTVKRQPAKT
jgi:thioredoxin-dependent peroxiredoxin